MRNTENIHAIHPVNVEIAVKFDAVSFFYNELRVLSDVSFHIHRGELVALVGPNGSGKTTLLKILIGLERPASGKIEIFGLPQDGSLAWRDRLGYVPQQPPGDQSFPIEVREVVRMGLLRPLKGYASTYDAVDFALERAGIADLAKRSYRALSGGQRRRVLVARALASQPDILVLDEPTANMDNESETRLFETLGALKGKTTILIVTHDTEFVSVLVDRVLCLGNDGKGIVQHRIEADSFGGDHRGFLHGNHAVSATQGARVLHGENIPADDCYT